MIKQITVIVIVLTMFSLFHTVNAESKEKAICCCYYDISDYKKDKLTEERIKVISEQLRNSEASIIILTGLKDENEFTSIKTLLNGFSFAKLVKTANFATRIAMISKIEPSKIEALTNLTYNIKKGVPLPVERGFIHAVFNIDGYILHIFGANLKDRSKNQLYNQYDMRRYEARKLRSLITSTIKKSKKEPANILLLAGLNDTCGKAPVKDVYNRRFGIPKRLFDLRPVDSINVSWTAIDENRDEYERIDYAIISSGLIPEIVFNETMIIENPKWRTASMHRPITVTIAPVNKPLWSDEKINKEFPHTIRSSQFKIGQKRKRGSEAIEIEE